MRQPPGSVAMAFPFTPRESHDGNPVCLYSISTGISTRIIQNLKRFHTPLERVEPVLETLFPFGAEVSSYQKNKRHLNPLPPFGKIDMGWIGQDAPSQDPSDDEKPSDDEHPLDVEDEDAVLEEPEGGETSEDPTSGDKS